MLLAGFLGLGISGCLQTQGQRKAELRERADELLPADGRVRARGYGDCVELAASPSCTEVVFELQEHDSGRRARLVRAVAARQGWTVTHSDDAQGGWSVFLKRDGFTAVVFLWRPEAYHVECEGELNPRSDSERFCFNTLSVSHG